jgi:ribonuclease Z
LKGVLHKPLPVIGPRPLERFLNTYSTLEDIDMQFLDCEHTLKSSVEAFHFSVKVILTYDKHGYK